MSLRYLVDTDWVIHWLNGHEEIRRRLNAVKEQGLAVSVISLAELYEGVHYGGNPKAAEDGLRDFLAGAELLLVDQATAEVFGRERGRLRAARKIIGDFDLIIAATALHRGLTLLHQQPPPFRTCRNAARRIRLVKPRARLARGR